MPPFGVKRFKRKEQAALEEALAKSPQFHLPTHGSSGKKKDRFVDFPSVVSIANKIFGFNGWSYSVTHETVDFLDYKDEKFDVGVSALVKVTLRDGSFREDVGYGMGKGMKCRGSSLAKARQIAAQDALKNTLSTFGNAFCVNQANGKVTDYFSPSQPSSNSRSVLSGVKRKLDLEFDVEVTERETGNSSPKPGPSSRHQVSELRDESAFYSAFNDSYSIMPNSNIHEQSVATLCETMLEDNNDMHCISSSSAQCPGTSYSKSNHQGGSSTLIGYSSQKGTYSPNCTSADEERLQRKLRQYDLEIEARQKARDEILASLK